MKKMCFFLDEKLVFLCCGVWDEVVEQKGTLPPSKSSIGRKRSARKKNKFAFSYIFIFILFIVFFLKF